MSQESLDPISKLHSELDLARYEERLKAITALWKRIQHLQKQARQDSRYQQPYRDLLVRSIERLDSEELGPAEFHGLCAAYWAAYAEQRAKLNVADLESRRHPACLEDWCQRWLPTEYANFERAWNTLLDSDKPTRSLVSQTQTAMLELIEAYAKAV